MTIEFQGAVEQSPVGICLVDRHGGLQKVNQRFVDLLGYGASDLLRRRLCDITHPDDVDADRKESALLVAGQLHRYAVDKRFICKDGGVLHGRLSVSLGFPGAGGRGHSFFICVLTELQEQNEEILRLRADLAEKESHFRESYARFKNVMQVIISMVRLTESSLKNDSAAAVLAELRNRILALSLIHEGLDRENPMSSIDLRACFSMIVGEALQSVGITDGRVRTAIEVPPLHLGFSEGQALVVIVNELVTNSLKHAFSPGQEGEVRVHLQLSGNGDIVLTVSDNGSEIPRSVDWRKSDGLGLRLVATAAESYLDGAFDLKRDKGNHFTVSFNLPETACN